MMNKFYVGQEVVESRYNGYSNASRVSKITKTTVTTEKGRKYSLSGKLWGTASGSSGFFESRLVPMTDGIKLEILKKNAKRKCLNMLDDIRTKVSGRICYDWVVSLEKDLTEIVKKMEQESK